MNRRIHPVRILLPILLCSSGGLPAQPVDPVSVGLAGGSAAEGSGAWSSIVNPAVGSSNPIGLIAVSTGRLPGADPDVIAACAVPLDRQFEANLSLSSSGYGPWREIDGAVGFSGLFGRLSIGLRLHANSIAIDRYGSAVHPTLDGGVQIPIDTTLRLGLTLRNLTGTTRLERPLQQEIIAGLSLSPDSSLRLLLDVTSTLDREMSVRLGSEYEFIAGCRGRAGLATAPLTAAFGLGLALGPFRLDYGAALRPDLGLLHAFGGGMSW